ncbi:MAG: peptidylprolyl isomerase [Frankiales bacterium]|nr:peptidylprolyl isomerase [Frankiales bacterium]
MASSKREKELARQRAERQAARRAAATQRTKQRNLVIASAVAVAVVAVAAISLGVVSRGGKTDVVATAGQSAEPVASVAPSADASSGASPAAGVSPAANAPGTCTYEPTSEPAAKKVGLPPTSDVEFKQEFTVTLATNRGDIVFDMPSAEAPCTANSLRSLAHFAYFDNTPCHRLTTQGISVLQCGDPSGTGGGGPGYQFADENLKGATYPRGTVAMANAGPGTNGSQFFLVYADSSLPPNYTPFGTITKGLDLLDTVAKAGSDDSNGAGDGKPKLPVEIKTLRVTPKAA